MLVGAHGRLVDRLVGGFESDIEDHDSTVVTSSSNKCGMGRMAVNAHDSGLSLE